MKKANHRELKAWIVSIRMGLGHQRAANALKYLAEDQVLNVGEPYTSDEEEIKFWKKITGSYEAISRLKKVPLIGKLLFNIMDRMLSIPPFYPLRDLSKPNLMSKLILKYIEKGMGKKLMKKINSKPLPMISTYPVPALIGNYFKYGRNYCVVTDAQINRGWVPVDPVSNKIWYFAPCQRALLRLREYGVRDDRIFLTGFPLPKNLLGSEKLEILLADLGQRLHYLDPDNHFWPLHGTTVSHFLGQKNTRFQRKRKLTITYAVGGAGALWEVGLQIAKSMRKHILKDECRLFLICGVREEVRNNFVQGLKELKIPNGKVTLIYSPDIQEYFDLFAETIRVTDILWTKPSELVFYSGLGIPIVMTEPVGAQEVYNKKWLLEIQAGIEQGDPEFTDQWLCDLLHMGRLAECAWDGFLKARKYGIYKIEEVLRTGTMIWEKSPLRR